MPRLIAFLRAINVGGHNVTMAELRGIFEALGFEEVETFIASGNVIFTSGSTDIGALQPRIEDHLRKPLGYEVTTFIRTVAEVAAIAQYKPFKEPQLQSAVALNVGFLAELLTPEAKRSLMSMRSEIDDFHVNGREVYWLCKGKQGESKFSNTVFERALKVRTTLRGINTIRKLAAKYAR
ncbi:MAG TPA: DUF1697 domain-containing protein [Blastocatellia bacterium]|nr:DUF1697 domain-containing protein [Blastocatellia bacterium]